MYVDEEMTQRDPEIGKQLEKMAEEIKAAMTGPALKFYERESLPSLGRSLISLGSSGLIQRVLRGMPSV